MGSGRFSDGFVLGALVGGAAIFLLGTKKGNKILKTITDEGLDGLTDIIENLEGQMKGTSPVPSSHPKKVKTSPEVKKSEPILDIDHVEDRIELEPVVTKDDMYSEASSRRFFKRKN